MTIGEKIRELREAKGITVEGLGNLCGITRQRMQAIETSPGYPLIPTIQKIARALGCPMRDLLDEPLELHLAAPDPLKNTDCPCENAEKCMFFKARK